MRKKGNYESKEKLKRSIEI